MVTVLYRRGDSNRWVQLRYGTAEGRILTVRCTAVTVYGTVDIPSSETIPGSVVGLSVIKHTMLALKNYQFEHEHLYKCIPEAQIGFHLDACI